MIIITILRASEQDEMISFFIANIGYLSLVAFIIISPMKQMNQLNVCILSDSFNKNISMQPLKTHQECLQLN